MKVNTIIKNCIKKDNFSVYYNTKNQIIRLQEHTPTRDYYVLGTSNGGTITTEINHAPDMKLSDWISYTVIRDKNNKLTKLIEFYKNKKVTITEENFGIVSKS